MLLVWLPILSAAIILESSMDFIFMSFLCSFFVIFTTFNNIVYYEVRTKGCMVMKLSYVIACMMFSEFILP